MRTIVDKLKRSLILSPVCLLALAMSGPHVAAERTSSKIVCRTSLAPSRRQELAEQLRAITGWTELRFDDDGFLRFGDAPPVGGSQTARALLAYSQLGKNLIIIEDVSGSADVVFCRVIEGRWKNGAAGKPAAYVVQIDFADFTRVMGDKEARAGFNAGWGVMHEIEHVVHDSIDPEGPGSAGECEQSINQMRRECGLAERAEYFYTFIPGQSGEFKTRYVRLAFERDRASSRRRRYWLYWDADIVGGLPTANPLAAR